MVATLQVISATSSDEIFAPENVLIGNETAPWITTGMFPQELVTELEEPEAIKQVKLTLGNAKKVRIGLSSDGKNYVTASEQELQSNNGLPKTHTFKVSNDKPIQRIKVEILSGHHDFIAFYRIAAE